MAHNIAKNAVERTSDELLGKVFPNLGKVAGAASRAVFGTGRSTGEDMAGVPRVRTALRSPTRRVDATVRWRTGFFPSGDAHLPVLVVSSTSCRTAARIQGACSRP